MYIIIQYNNCTFEQTTAHRLHERTVICFFFPFFPFFFDEISMYVLREELHLALVNRKIFNRLGRIGFYFS